VGELFAMRFLSNNGRPVWKTVTGIGVALWIGGSNFVASECGPEAMLAGMESACETLSIVLKYLGQGLTILGLGKRLK
jgi:hypothetical protein